MVHLSTEFQERVIQAMFEDRKNYDLTDANYAQKRGINPAVFSRLKKGERANLLKPMQYLNIGRDLNVTTNEHKWVMARTDVFNMIEEDVLFCKAHSKARICVDDCGIGKTYAAKYLSLTIKNCYYLDASQCKSLHLFVRQMAKVMGIELGHCTQDKLILTIKYYIKQIENPIIIIDEAGDLEANVFLLLKEMWNATENCCGWYLMGADGLRRKIERGIDNKRIGFKELFSRYSDRYSSIVPINRTDKQAFYKKLIGQVLAANMEDTTEVNKLVKRCLVDDDNGNIGGLRRAQSLLILTQQQPA